MADFVHTSMGNIKEVDPPVNPGLPGNRNNETLQNAFELSPIYEPNADDVTKTQFKDLVQDGALDGTGLKGSGFGLSRFSRDFEDAPDIEGIVKDKDGKELASPYAPNVASPNAAGDIENIVLPTKGAGGSFQGDGLKNPKATTATIRNLTIGSYGIGTSGN